MVIFNVAILFVFKYLMFFLQNVNLLLNTDFHIPQIALPIGISFFTFHSISYVIDVYRKKVEVQRNPLILGLYISLFSQLVAGPIVRYSTVSDQLWGRKETLGDFCGGIWRFMVGFVKKVFIANNVAIVADRAFAAAADESSVALLWLGCLAYTLQIFFDFAGYSDMALGLGRMYGFHFLENFNYPYISASISEFWRRWHMSLGSWFRDYVYIPLGGSRVKTKGRLVFNLFVVWALTGVWHGANWTFILWGLMYFCLITVEKLTSFEDWGKGFMRRTAAHIYTMFFVCMGWVLFRAESIGEATLYLKGMFGATDIPAINDVAVGLMQEYSIFIIVGILFSSPIVPWVENKIEVSRSSLRVGWNFALLVVLGIMFLFCIGYLVKGSFNPFIYFNF